MTKRVKQQRPSMLSELTRWMPPERVAGNRWADWAGSFAEKYGRGAHRPNALGFVLAAGLRQVSTIRERWFLRSERLFPTINLSVNAVLRMMHSPVFGRLSGEQSSNLRAPYGEAVLRPHRANDPVSVAIDRRLVMSDVEYVRRTESLSSLERIFQRTQDRPTVLRLNGSRDVGQSNDIQQRLVQQTRRIESALNAFAPAVVSSNSAARASSDNPRTERALTQDLSSFPTSDPFRRSIGDNEFIGNPRQQNRAFDAVNIDQITDQVIRQLDRKVMAARERMGKTF